MTQFETIAQEITEPENLNLSDLSRVVLEKALERNGGNRNKAAQDLGISTRTLYRRLKEFGIK
jgi:DNA-binding NtrC family response regulator